LEYNGNLWNSKFVRLCEREQGTSDGTVIAANGMNDMNSMNDMNGELWHVTCGMMMTGKCGVRSAECGDMARECKGACESGSGSGSGSVKMWRCEGVKMWRREDERGKYRNREIGK
jgi:hypothetical protein